jgi:signal transduction histidine kinase
VRSDDLRSYLASGRPPIEIEGFVRILRTARVLLHLAIVAATLIFIERFDNISFVVTGICALSISVIVHNTVRPNATVFEILTFDTAAYLLMTVVIDAAELAVFAAVAMSFMMFHFVVPRRAVIATIVFVIGGLAAAAASLFTENQIRSPGDVLHLLTNVTVLTAVPAIWLQAQAGIEVFRHKEKEAQLARDKDELLADKDRFVASVSHELRTPLTAVLGLAHTLADSENHLSEDERAEFLDTLVQQSEDVAAIVDDLLVAARAGSGQLALTIAEVDLVAEVKAIAPEGLPIHTNGGATVLGDPIRIRQIVRNLLTNAQRYGGPNREIRVHSTESRGVVAVADDGEALSSADLGVIFTAYGRAHESPGHTESVGLGLTVSRQLARLMGGEVAYSHRSGWSTFELSLPVPVDRPSSARV